jgi:hypothetical protein
VRRRALLAAALVGVVGAGIVVVRAERDRTAEPPHPKEWDAQVLPLARFVEQARGLRYRHPVAVEYLADADFVRAAQAAAGDDTEDERADRALGLPGGPHGLAEADRTLSGETVSAFYDDHTKRIEVRGKDLDVLRRATVVHELTHALQDQHFDLSRDGSYDSDDRNAAFDAVVEGDAVRLQNAYVESLPKADQDAYDKATAADEDAPPPAGGAIPDWLAAVSDFPYSVGYPFTDDLAAQAGRAAVDRAFRSPPRAVAYVIDLARYRRGERPAAVTPSPAPAGAKVLRRNDVGELRWMLVLAERLPAGDAFRAAQGWAGDADLAYEASGRVCVKADFAGVAPPATDVMEAALRRWAAAMPPGAGATVTRRPAAVEVASCDPGAAAFPGGAVAGSQAEEAMTMLVEAAGGGDQPAGAPENAHSAPTTTR